MRQLGEVLRLSAGYLSEHGSPTPRLDAELLVGHALGLPRIELYTNFDRPLDEPELAACRALLERRGRREPVAYILGRWGFHGLDLAVDGRVLVPRPETEVLVERCLALLEGREAPRVVDVGTGSGAIALALADEHAGAQVTGIDASADALALARENAERCGLTVALELRDALLGLPAGPWDVVVSNPPYVPEAERDSLLPEVRDWEPAASLFANGVTEAIARSARDVLAETGAVVLEAADGAARDVAALLESLGYAQVRVTKDLTGRERVVEGRR